MYHYTQGKPTKQAHKAIPEGCYEEEQGLKGFFGPVSHLIRKNPSTRWKNIDGDLKPRLFDLVKVPESTMHQRLLFNKDINIYMHWETPTQEKSLAAFRSADGDMIYFCHKGKGLILTEYGLLTYEKGQYIVIPKCIAYFIYAEEVSNFLVIENKTSHFQEPDRGLVGRHAIYDQNAIRKPDLEKLDNFMQQNELEVLQVKVKHLEKVTTFTYEENVFDVIGWKGDLFPFTLHTDDMMPLMSHRAHLPPSAHTTFVAREFVVCTFLPRPLERDKDALKVPFYHQNIDYDEVLFYHDGDFFSRDNLHAGMMSFHPAGFPHGPHPKAITKINDKTDTDEYAVMIDTRWPLQRDPFMDDVEVKDYWQSWQK